MSVLNKRNSVIILGLLLIIVAVVGASRSPKKDPLEKVGISFSESELDNLGESIKGLEFDDLGGLSGDEFVGVEDESADIELSEIDLDKLGEAIQGLEFEDLGGLTDN
ncbi:hypothetical protein ACFL0D_02240 [Thermoproteota archaeon]